MKRWAIDLIFGTLGFVLIIVGICSFLPFAIGLGQMWPLILIILGIVLVVVGKSISLVGMSEEEKRALWQTSISHAAREIPEMIIIGLCVIGLIIGLIGLIAVAGGVAHAWPLLVIGGVSLIILVCAWYWEEIRDYFGLGRRRELTPGEIKAIHHYYGLDRPHIGDRKFGRR